MSRLPWAKRKPCVFALVAIVLAACQPQTHLLPYTETVLSPGMTVVVNHPTGKISIAAGPGTERIFSGPGWTKTRYLIPRQERWYGSLGLYDPADSIRPAGRLLADEGRLFFTDESEALRYLKQSSWAQTIFTSSGLVVTYQIVPYPGGGREPTRSLQLWQIYINGRRPTHLAGAHDRTFSVTGGTIPENARPYPAPVGYPQFYTEKPVRTP